METNQKVVLTVKVEVKQGIEKVWNIWSDPKFIVQWYNASDDWHAPFAENDLKVGGKFKTTMAAKDGSFSFDFEGTYTNIEKLKLIDYEIIGGRRVRTVFSGDSKTSTVAQTFEAENENPPEMQKTGWQNILNNFKKCAEEN